jgi:glycosyltransferase involved in cell wall biosynthesis
LEDAAFADMPAVYNGAAVLTLPSHYEGFGFPPLEAMACGIPTVVSNRGSLPEVVGSTGLLVDPDDPVSLAAALQQALTDAAFRERSRAAGLQRAQEFTWQRTAEIVREVYQSVLS